jgi:hypothetical protein
MQPYGYHLTTMLVCGKSGQNQTLLFSFSTK